MDTPTLINTADAAQMIGIRPETLRQWRMIGQGPSFLKLGKLVKYRRSTVLQWIDNLEEQTITSRS
jgi:hypothetical protein